jgi:hypothetical protein
MVSQKEAQVQVCSAKAKKSFLIFPLLQKMETAII